MFASMIPTEWSTALDTTADELLEKVSITAPPVDALHLAERLGISVVFDDDQPVRARHKRLAGQATILIKPDERPERLQWAVAHELGEVIAYRVFARVDLYADSISPRLREEVANLTASRLLLPSRWFFDDARRSHEDLLALKKIYRTASHELITCRLLDGPRQSIITIFDNGRITRRLANRPGRPPGLQRVERDCRAEIHRHGRPVELREQGLTVQGWPVHEPDWKREILRTTTADR